MGIVLHSNEGIVLECNDVAANFFAMTVSQLTGLTLREEAWGAVRVDGTPFPAEHRPELLSLRERRVTAGTVVGFDVVAQGRKWLALNTSPAVVNGSCVGIVSSFVDVTEQIRREHTLRLIHSVSRIAMSTTDETELLQRLCDELVALSDYSLAWIGEPSECEPGILNLCFSAGRNACLDEDIVSTLASPESGLGPTATALRLGTTQVVNDLKNQKQYGQWCARATQLGLSSSIAIPFYPGGRFAVLTIYDRHPFAFNSVTKSGLEDVTSETEQGIAYQRSVRKLQTALEETSTSLHALQQTEESRSKSEQRFRKAFEDNMAPMVFSDLHGIITAANDAYCTMVGLSRDELLGLRSDQITCAEDVGIAREMHQRLIARHESQVRYVKRYERRDGRVVVSEVSLSAASDEVGNLLYFVSSERDITEERELTSKLTHQALHDPLTGLANRSLLEDRLSLARSRAHRQGGMITVLMIDLDEFKGVNDTYGHLVGDELLVGVARRFESVGRPTDTLCRFGGDEFLYLAEGLATPEEGEELARRFLNVLATPFSFDGKIFEQHASVGVVTWDPATADPFALVQKADVALFEAKRRYKGAFASFNESMQDPASTHFTLNQELRRSLEAGELSMHYQPIMELASQLVVGYEALMRWEHPTRGSIAPDMFIPLAEQSDTIFELGSFALEEAIAQASTWPPRSDFHELPYFSVNLATRQFHDPRLVSTVERLLSESSLEPRRLVLEITESTALVNVAESLDVLGRLKNLGVQVALDDFGTGYSSLSYLLQLKPDIIKIDRSFVSPEVDSEQSEMVLGTIIALGEKLGVTLVAEGVETEEQLEKLLRLGCTFGQGHYFSYALKATDVVMADSLL